MQTICDIYLLENMIGSSKLLKQLKIFAPEIVFHDNTQYVGFLGLNLKRLKTVAIAIHLKNNGISCFNVPVRYRDEKLLSAEAAALVAAEKSLQGPHHCWSGEDAC